MGVFLSTLVAAKVILMVILYVQWPYLGLVGVS